MNPRIPETVTTDRLLGTRLAESDIDVLIGLEQDPRVYPTLWGRPSPPTEHDVRAGHERRLEHWRQHGFGVWLLRDRATGAFIGRAGLQYTRAVGVDDVEAAWAIVPERQGEGLATELARAAIAAAFDDLRLDSLITLTLPDNLASRRVMEKIGCTYERDVTHAELPHVLYRLRRRAPDTAGAVASVRAS